MCPARCAHPLLSTSLSSEFSPLCLPAYTRAGTAAVQRRWASSCCLLCAQQPGGSQRCCAVLPPVLHVLQRYRSRSLRGTAVPPGRRGQLRADQAHGPPGRPEAGAQQLPAHRHARVRFLFTFQSGWRGCCAHAGPAAGWLLASRAARALSSSCRHSMLTPDAFLPALASWKFIRFGPDGKLYLPIGAPCNNCLLGSYRWGWNWCCRNVGPLVWDRRGKQ